MRLFFITTFFLTLCSCKNEKKAEFNAIGNLPEVVSVDSLKATDFIPTMESNLVGGKNLIYCPTLLYAWDEIRKVTGELKVQEDKDKRTIIQLNDSKAHENSLSSNEYRTEVEINGQEIIGKAEFNTELTFIPYLEKMDSPLIFKQNNVNGFGMINWNYEIAKQVNILYFKDNDNFVFKINPQQKDNEIFFIMGSEFNKAKTFSEISKKLKEHILIGENEIKNNISPWKYFLKEHESFAIPELAFNIEKSYNELVNQTLYNDKNKYIIKISKQRNALLLNNKGGKIGSEAEIVLEAAKVSSTEEKIIEKHLFLNKTFYIIFKHNSKPNPYFCIKIDNDELMTKFKKE